MATGKSSAKSPDFPEDLPKEKFFGKIDLYQWEGFWYRLHHLEAAIAAQSNFVAQDDDVLLASPTKAGSTWLKALIPSIIMANNNNDSSSNNDIDDTLLENHPNDLMPSLEFQICKTNSNFNLSNLNMPSPRLFRTHLPYFMLSESIKTSGCKIVYITRDPKDVFISLWHFINSATRAETDDHQSFPIEEAFDSFSRGVHNFGPFHDHVLGYWKESLAKPDKILFLKYEEMKSDPRGEVSKLASFLGRPFANVDEVDKVLERCSLERLKSLDVNKEGKDPWTNIPKNAYFRRGIVGDYKNHLTPEMKERLDEITRNKFEGSGLETVPK